MAQLDADEMGGDGFTLYVKKPGSAEDERPIGSSGANDFYFGKKSATGFVGLYNQGMSLYPVQQQIG